ncbi:MAG: oligosaccharide flippase family protein [Thermoplasmata archaeon]
MAFVKQFFGDLRTPLYKNAIYLMANIVLMSGLGFFFWMVVARYYAPHEVGLAATIIPILVLIGTLSRFGFEFGLVRFLPSSGENSRLMINSCLTISGLAAIIISIIFLIGLDIWSPPLLFIREDWIFLLSFVVFSMAFALNPLMNYVFVTTRNGRFILAGTSITGLKILFPILFASFFGAFGIFASWSVAMLIALLVGLFIFIPKANPGYTPLPTVRKSAVKKMLRFSMGNYFAGILSVMPSSLLPLVIVNVLEARDVAYYYVAFTVASLFFAIASAICLSLFAEGSRFERELSSIVRKAAKLAFAILAPGIIIVFFFGKYLLLMFGSVYSSEGLILLQILVLSSTFLTFNGIFLATRLVLKRLRPIIAISAFNAFATIGLGYAFLLSMGLVGIAFAWALSQGIVSVGVGIYLVLERARIVGDSDH